MRKAFGDGILNSSGELDRRALADIVFSDGEKLALLNSIAHAYISEEILLRLEELERNGVKVAVLDAPQLFEAGLNSRCDVTAAIIAPEEGRIERVCARDGVSRDEAKKRISMQHSDDFFEKNCDYTLKNPQGHFPRDMIEKIYKTVTEEQDMENTTEKLKEKLFMKQTNAYDGMSAQERGQMNAYAEGYMDFIGKAKTEREAVRYAVEQAEAHGYRPYTFGTQVKAGDKFYFDNRGKSFYIFRIGTESIENGIRISAAHVDSPRIDLKGHPVYEDGNMGFFKTHYYGGIKKYQWTTIPLSLHGVVTLKDGTNVDFNIGEGEGDPVFYINDLLPHLAGDQMKKTLADGITGESLNILIGSEPYPDTDATDRIKLNILKLLNDKYGITEADFMSAEISAVPAYKPREIGFDRSLIGAYGHDDRVCAYPELTAMFASEDSVHTCMAIFADKEETGSDGNTGMKTWCFVDIINEIAASLGANPNTVRMNSKCLSADVNAAYDPNYADAFEKRNSSLVNEGVVLTKFTGSRGKYGTNDASAEFMGYVRGIFDRAGVVWQTAELGKVDVGGGGTVAKIISEKNIEVVDLGVAVIAMHAPYEVISKADLYMTYKAICAFNND